jgi:hypothetical protein
MQVKVTRLERENESLKQEITAAQSPNANLDRSTNTTLETAGAIALGDGKYRISLSESGALAGLESVPENYRDMVRDALKEGRIEVATAPTVRIGQMSSSRGHSDEQGFQVLYPVNQVVESTRPKFRWRPVPGASRYTVFIKDIGTGEETDGEPITETTWTTNKPLSRGHTYAWMVSALVDGRRLRAPAPSEPFAAVRVLDEASVREIDRARGSYSESHLIMGLLYAKAGLRIQAQRRLKELVAQNAGSELAKKLLLSVK